MREILDSAVGELMSTNLVTVTPETSIEALTQIMTLHDYNAFPVVDDTGVLQGLVTRLDLVKVYLLPYHRFLPVLEDTWVSSVGAIMSRGFVTLYPVEPAIKAVALMVEHRIRTIPIVTDTVTGRTVLGVGSRRDLAASLNP